jgi:hypothetical protein
VVKFVTASALIVYRWKHTAVWQITFEEDAAPIDRQANLKRRFARFPKTGCGQAPVFSDAVTLSRSSRIFVCLVTSAF